jgi:large subunit ribosomal protein L17
MLIVRAAYARSNKIPTMRHGKKLNHLGRKASHRKAMMKNMAVSLLLEKRIFTTLAKAKALRTYVEPIITRGKEANMHNYRVAYSYLQSKEAVDELFQRVGPKVASRPGGYTRILKTGKRLGDNAEMCLIELVDYNEAMLQDAGAKTRRSRKKKGADAPAATDTPAPAGEQNTEA